jgi:recombinational DNA repair protein RecT
MSASLPVITIRPVYECRFLQGDILPHWLRHDPEDPESPPATRYAAYVRVLEGFSLIVGLGGTEDEALSRGLQTVIKQEAAKAKIERPSGR